MLQVILNILESYSDLKQTNKHPYKETNANTETNKNQKQKQLIWNRVWF